MAIIEFSTDRLEETQPEPVRERFLGRLTGPLSEGWGARLTLAWIGVYTIGLVFEPAPANPNATPGFVEVVIGWVFLTAWTVMAVGFAKRRRYGAATSLFAGGLFAALTVACPVSGHHEGISAWWLFEAAGSAALVWLSVRALKES